MGTLLTPRKQSKKYSIYNTMIPLYESLRHTFKRDHALDMNNLINLCKMSQPDLYNILVNELKMHGYKVYANDQASSCSRYIYAEGNIPICLTAHLDTVFAHNRNKIINISGDKISSPDGLGADDRVGVYAILEIIKTHRCNVLFLEDEECGHSGAVHFISGPYKDMFVKQNNFCIDLDMAGSNILTFYETTNSEFQKDIKSILPRYKIRDPKEGASDLIELTIGWDKEGRNGPQHFEGTNKASLNIGVGYYDEHTLNEYVKFTEVQKAIKDVKKIIDKMPNKQYVAR